LSATDRRILAPPQTSPRLKDCINTSFTKTVKWIV
jgi:hypothetical protein